MGYALGYFYTAYVDRAINFISLCPSFVLGSSDTPDDNGGLVPHGSPVRWFEGTKKGRQIKLQYLI